LCISFLLVGASYAALPREIPLLRDWTGHGILWATKSPVTAFRIPFMGLISASIAAVMRNRARTVEDPVRRAGYSDMWSVLLWTAAIKSLFEVMEFRTLAAPTLLEHYAGSIGTIASVVVGIALALARGWKVLSAFDRTEWRLARRDRIVLASLVVLYAAVAVLPLVDSHRGTSPP
jgi:hypothetical protein